MKNYWLDTNTEKAAIDTFYQTIGYLKKEQAFQYEISIDKLLEYMYSAFNNDLERLNNTFPDKQ